ncbi:sensor histidine kinase [Elioraea thermophila]|uniref:sensor histidine kinase n=1 Tax=Elioraea thermophila TaxID=2185104 RepID=UPI000DF2FAEE|nr:ATP-binding protein [Elioraea thermophila]
MIGLFRASLRARLGLVACVSVAVVLGASGLWLEHRFGSVVTQAFDRRLETILIAIASALDVDDDTGAVVVAHRLPDPRFEAALSGWYWEVEEEGAVIAASRSLWGGRIAPSGPRGETLRILGREVPSPGEGGPLIVRVAAPEAALAEERAEARAVVVATLAPLAVLLSLLAAVLVSAALAPLTRLARGLDAVRRGETKRLAAPPERELAPFAEAVNGLLESHEVTLARARSAAADLSHALKTPLAALATLPDPDGRIADQVERMRRLTERHLARARIAGTAYGERTPARRVLEDLLVVMRRIHPHVAFTLEGPEAQVAVETADLEEMLGALLDNAGKWAARSVRARIVPAGRQVTIAIEDDGPGLADAEAARARGVSLDRRRAGSGLGLAVVDEIAALYGATLRLGRSDAGGLAAALDLPAA